MTSTRLLALALLVTPAAALAQRTYIEVGSPNFQPLPVAVAPFLADPGATAEAALMNQVIRGDLLLSGVFDVLDPKAFLADPGEGLIASAINFTRWSDVGAEGLVKALVRGDEAQPSAEFHLYEVRAAKEVLTSTLSGSPGSARTLAHRFADQVFQYYTREPGVFQTRILALRKTAAGREIVVYDMDGRGPEVLYRDPGIILLPNWRPDGRVILFTAFRQSRSELWTFDLATRRAQRLIGVGDVTTGGVYSPDGRRIAFTASVEGNSDVWVANADGTQPHRLTSDPGIDGSPSWSPDGKRLCFVSNRAGNPHIYVMNADGSGQRRLTFQGNYNQTPRWSPRGDLIAFTARDERKVFDIFTVTPDTGRIQRVTQDQGPTNEEPTWAPNGRLLAFTSDRLGRPQLVISSPTGDRQMVVTHEEAEIATPAWGPFVR
ncbi:MAG TPA: Tol-Pal system beta propeller repeat protein TolB [Anaeromyxobacteraceae bacterium]|nr:Tol-Pal system beta propeller repeat protein TolB [Anaeromyxobacteraceae bacterium]